MSNGKGDLNDEEWFAGLETLSGFTSVFVPADDEDQHALDFYRAVGGQAQSVTFFNFSP